VRSSRNGDRPKSDVPLASIDTKEVPHCFGQRGLRCPLLWPDPTQRPRLVEIRDNLIDRIAEAEREGWLGEVEGLRISLAAAADKLNQISQTTATGSCAIGHSGAPDVSNVVAVTITTRKPDTPTK